jgi:DNA invertase Pin-like site-specific DNA recombinase
MLSPVESAELIRRLDALGRRWEKLRASERELAATIREAVREAHAAGCPETQIAKAIRADRMTVRRALGKR